MLLLTRRQDQQILLNTPGGLIEIDVKRITGNQVRLGVTAPDNVHIVRSELLPLDADKQQTKTRPAA